MKPRESGQVLVVAILAMMVLLILVPLLVYHVNREAAWSVKEKKTTIAFHLADAAVDRGRWKLLQSAAYWTQTASGTLSGYNNDQAYTDIAGGTYAIKIYADASNSDYRDIDGVGKDSSTKEIRKVHAVFRNDSVGKFSIRASQGVTINASVGVEWGPVVSGLSISTGGRLHPRYYSAGHVSPQDGGSTAAGTDNVQWWSYYAVPPAPAIDFSFYESSASASGIPPSNCPSSYLVTSSSAFSFKDCNDTSGKPYVFQQANVTFDPGGHDGNFITGSVIVEQGSVTIQGNGGGKGSYAAHIPPTAWMEYGNDWTTYKGYDSSAPSTYNAASSYVASSTSTYNLSNVVVHGFIYAGNGFSLTGGGTSVFHGVLLSNQGMPLASSNLTVYYDSDVNLNIQVTRLVITRIGWYEVAAAWPAGLP